MLKILRPFATYLLLLLLPLQATAAVAAPCMDSMEKTHMAMPQMDMSPLDMACCDAAMKQQMASHDDGKNANQHQPSCETGASCALMCLMAATNTKQSFSSDAKPEPLNIFIPSLYISHIPAYLQRPPTLLV